MCTIRPSVFSVGKLRFNLNRQVVVVGKRGKNVRGGFGKWRSGARWRVEEMVRVAGLVKLVRGKCSRPGPFGFGGRQWWWESGSGVWWRWWLGGGAGLCQGPGVLGVEGEGERCEAAGGWGGWEAGALPGGDHEEHV